VIHPERPRYFRVKGGRYAGSDYRDKNRRAGNRGKGQKMAQQLSRQGEKAEENRPGYVKGDNAVEEIPRTGNHGAFFAGIFTGIFR
jgi:hypothetical protein